MNCPKDGYTLEFVWGDFSTGVVAPDGYRETRFEEFFVCPKCDTAFDEDDVSELEEV